MYHKVMSRVRVTIVAFAFWLTCGAINNVINTQNVDKEAEKCVPSVVDLHVSLPTYETHTGLHSECPMFLWDFSQIWIFSTDYRNSLEVKYHKNPSNENCADTCGRTNTTKLTGAFLDWRESSWYWSYLMALFSHSIEKKITVLWFPCNVTYVLSGLIPNCYYYSLLLRNFTVLIVSVFTFC